MTPDEMKQFERFEHQIAGLQEQLAKKIYCPLLEKANEKIAEMERRHAEDIKALRELMQ